MKKNIGLVLALLLILSSFSFICGEVNSDSVNKIQTNEGVTTEQFNEVSSVKYVFTKADASMNIGDKTYWNIQPATSTNEAFILVDNSNRVVEAKFKVNEKGGSYFFGDRYYSVPANSSVKFTNGSLMIESPEGSSISVPGNSTNSNSSLKLERATYKGRNLKLPGNGNVLTRGNIDFKDGSFYASEPSLEEPLGTVINNVGIMRNEKTGEVPIFFQEFQENSPEGVYFNGDKGFALNWKDRVSTSTKDWILYGKDFGSESPIITFLDKNPYFRSTRGHLLQIAPTDDFTFVLKPIEHTLHEFPISEAGVSGDSGIIRYGPIFLNYRTSAITGSKYVSPEIYLWETFGEKGHSNYPAFEKISFDAPAVDSSELIPLSEEKEIKLSISAPDFSQKQSVGGQDIVLYADGNVLSSSNQRLLSYRQMRLYDVYGRLGLDLDNNKPAPGTDAPRYYLNPLLLKNKPTSINNFP